MADEAAAVDYSLSNPDTLTKYKQAADIARLVLEQVTEWCTPGASILQLCAHGDALLAAEVAKVFKGKKTSKGSAHPVTVSPPAFVTPYSPLASDADEAAAVLGEGEVVKVLLGAQIDGFAAVVGGCGVVGRGAGAVVEGRTADLLAATYWANEVLLRLMVPRGCVGAGGVGEGEGKVVVSQARMTVVLEKVARAFGVCLVESTTSWLFERNEIEGKKRIVLAPGEGVKGEGLPEVGEVWGVEVGMSLGSGKVKALPNRATLHRRTATRFGLKRQSSKDTLNEVVRKFGTFPFSVRQLDDERAAKIGIMECVRGNVLRQYEVVGDAKGEAVSRLFTTVAITKNGLVRIAGPPPFDPELYKTDKKIEDEEVLKILEQPLAKPTSGKKKKPKKKKKTAAAAAQKTADADADAADGDGDEEDGDSEDE